MALSRIFVGPKNGQGGVKKSKKNFFQKKYSKDGKKILGPLGPFLQKIDFLKSGGQRGVGGGVGGIWKSRTPHLESLGNELRTTENRMGFHFLELL